MTKPTAVILGVGPGLGLSMAHRFGQAGHDVALVSRSDTRHAGYLAGLSEAGITAEAFTGDVYTDLGSTLDAVTERFGRIDVVYYGPAALGPDSLPKPILETGPADVRQAMNVLYPAVEVVEATLPGMLERGTGGFLFAGGLSVVRPMPAMGSLAVAGAALHHYAKTLHEGLAGTGVYAGSLVIGGLVERGDIYQMMTAQQGKNGDAGNHTLNPDEIADVAWKLYSDRESAEAVFDVLG
ncbi:SDR family NAD(P)-dependent oxidoreductase [Amycolatopsis jiangsuensis]|uniref:NAD(P)-dependent dehydrogenase (Short-subunit alcohol dehydrogenase family) n=1 Tax=Amycolatopsis jiangsuensis TaxID=1181879 RepID=A0A840IWP9_9PSEU|nr:SDR family NAD(P)-dependent oxidoreductase [Amycolatopsis jiangsuensis]MBB4686280.1 NAD(P)-dependent dehydrogenase (short-subunit alcohol dehydrogenase family) [Amycolatopsis jiangsuensis]